MGDEDLCKRHFLITSLQEAFLSSNFSDVTIVSKCRDFKVHKVIISMHCAYFDRAFKHNWKEVNESTISLEEDDPDALEAMIRFMYGFQYDNPISFGDRKSPMLFHAKVYEIADKYDIPLLKEEAQGKFKVAIERDWEMDDFPTAIVEAYSNTPATDRGLREAVVAVSAKNINELRKKDGFTQALRETIGFAADLILNIECLPDLTMHQCCRCQGKWYTHTAAHTLYCARCGQHWRSEWP